MSFHVGQKVVCVDARRNWGHDDFPLKKNSVYTVSGMCSYREAQDSIFGSKVTPRLCLAEIPEKTYGFHVSRFRPVIERKTETGMAILREIIDRESHQDKPPVKRTVHS